jgi:hypothetical protein
LLALPALLPGCKLLDQTTFEPSPEAAALPAPAPARAETRPALVTVRYDVPNPAWRDLLRYAITEAERRRPGLDYEVVAVAPASGAIADQVVALQVARRDGTEIMRAITALGVAPSRLRLSARTDPAATAREVRVYPR